MMHIAMLLSNPFRPDPRVLKEARSLNQHGYHITIICWDRKAEFRAKEELAAGIEVIRIQSARSDYALGARQINRIFRFWQAALSVLSEMKPDLVHCHDFDTLPVGLYWCRRNNTSAIYDAHEYYADLVKPRLRGIAGICIYWIIKYAERSLARRADAIITVDDSLANIYRAINSRVLVIGHYPSIELCNTPTSVFSKSTLNLLYTGRISNDRGSIAYLNLLRALLDRNIPTRLILAGVFTPVEEEKHFWEIARGVESYVKFHKWIQYDHIHEILQEGDVGLALLQPEPRYIAAIPVKLFEYMAAGLPVICSNFPLIQNLVESTKCGALVNPTDRDTTVELLCSWWMDPNTPKTLGENGRSAIRNSYNWESLAASLNRLYQSLLQK